MTRPSSNIRSGSQSSNAAIGEAQEVTIEASIESVPSSAEFVAGPTLLESALKNRRLDLFYLTLSHQFVGGDAFHTLIPEAELGHCRLIQKRLIFDDSPELKHSQWFAKFGCRYR